MKLSIQLPRKNGKCYSSKLFERNNWIQNRDSRSSTLPKAVRAEKGLHTRHEYVICDSTLQNLAVVTCTYHELSWNMVERSEHWFDAWFIKTTLWWKIARENDERRCSALHFSLSERRVRWRWYVRVGVMLVHVEGPAGRESGWSGCRISFVLRRTRLPDCGCRCTVLAMLLTLGIPEAP